VVPTVRRGPVGRVTVLFVDKDRRRKGIATRLIADTVSAVARKGCTVVEARDDNQIKNPHNVFRALKFDQTSPQGGCGELMERGNGPVDLRFER